VFRLASGFPERRAGHFEERDLRLQLQLQGAGGRLLGARGAGGGWGLAAASDGSSFWACFCFVLASYFVLRTS
jgi:hypothetical protein